MYQMMNWDGQQLGCWRFLYNLEQRVRNVVLGGISCKQRRLTFLVGLALKLHIHPAKFVLANILDTDKNPTCSTQEKALSH